MENFQNYVFKLAETHPNKPLPPEAKTLLQDCLNRFVSEYKTPDHPPYSAMIESALQELNRRRGSSQKSISQYIEERYDKLPWAHSELLKNHLEKLCESGELVVTNERYQLPGCLNSSTDVKSKPRRKWGRDRDRGVNSRKARLRKKVEKVRVGEDKLDQGNHSSFLLTVENEKKYLEEVRSQDLGIEPIESSKADIPASQTQAHERSQCSQAELLSAEECHLPLSNPENQLQRSSRLCPAIPQVRRLRVLFKSNTDASSVDVRQKKVLANLKE